MLTICSHPRATEQLLAVASRQPEAASHQKHSYRCRQIPWIRFKYLPSPTCPRVERRRVRR